MQIPKHKHLVSSILVVTATIVAAMAILVAAPRPGYAATNSTDTPDQHFNNINTGDPVVTGGHCGDSGTRVSTSLNYGCHGNANGIEDLLFAIVRFLSAGVGLVVIASVVFAGIQYTSSQGDPARTAQAIARIRNTLLALAIYIFAFALLNWLVPGGLI